MNGNEQLKEIVINDPLGQTHSLSSSEHCFRLKYVGADGRMDGRKICGKIVITAGRDCGLAEWIKRGDCHKLFFTKKEKNVEHMHCDRTVAAEYEQRIEKALGLF